MIPKDSDKRQPAVTDNSVSENGPSRARGRYTFTPDVIGAICDRVRQGTFTKHACALEMVSRSAFYEVLDEEPGWRDTYDAARAEGSEMYRGAMRMSLNDWKREAWLLERWDRETFKPPKAEVESKNEHTGKDGAPLVPVAPRTRAEALAELDRLRAIAAETAADVDDIEKGK